MDVIVIFAVLVSYFIKGLAGFANTLVFSSILSFHMTNKIISPMDLILGLPSNMYLAWKERKSVSAKIVVPLSLLVLAGQIPGAFFLKIGDQRQLKIILGIIIIVFGFEMLLRLQNTYKVKSNTVLLSFIGILSGFLCGLFGIGAFLAAYISRTTENQSQFKGNICCVFIFENIFRFVLYTVTGILTMDILKSTLVLLPVMITGLLTGIAASRHMEEKTVKIAVVILLIVTGTSLVLKNIL